MKKLIPFLLAITLLAGCGSPKQVIPVSEPTDITKLLVKPPAKAMVPPHEPIPMVKGDNKAGNSVVFRQNNMLCVDDRQKLTILQQYILGIFPAK